MARSFNGSSDNIRADAAKCFSLQSAYAWAGWIKCPAQVTPKEWFSESRQASANPFLQIFTTTGGKAIIAARGDAGGTSAINSVQSTATVIDSAWHHFVFTIDGAGNYRYFVDGAADKTGTYTASATTIDELAIGCQRVGGVNGLFFPGVLAEVATWTAYLTLQDARTLYAGFPPSYVRRTLLRAYWPLLGADSPEPDYSGGKFAGTLTGTAAAPHPPVNSIVWPSQDYLEPGGAGDVTVEFSGAEETDTAGTFDATHIVEYAGAEETDTAGSFDAVHVVEFSGATETDTAGVWVATVVPPEPVMTLAGDGQMIPLEYLTDDEEVLLMAAALIR